MASVRIKVPILIEALQIRPSHPNLVQLYGIVNSPGLHAAVFHDSQYISLSSPQITKVLFFSSDLIPPTELLQKYRNSHLSTVFLWVCMVCHVRSPSGLTH
jgi:hypothetical protein